MVHEALHRAEGSKAKPPVRACCALRILRTTPVENERRRPRCP